MRFTISCTDAVMPLLGRPDEDVERAVEGGPRLAEDGFHLVAVGERIDPLLAGRALDVLAVLVVSHQEEHVVARGRG